MRRVDQRRNEDRRRTAAAVIAECIAADGIVHVFGSGHSAMNVILDLAAGQLSRDEFTEWLGQLDKAEEAYKKVLELDPKHKGAKVATLMDFGCFTDLIREKLAGCDAVVVESNHSRDMLRACPVYSWSLKQRIASRTGHLSNEDLSDWLQNDFDGSARHIVLAHLSQRSNDPALARITAETALKMRAPLFAVDTRITLSNHKDPTEWFSF